MTIVDIIMHSVVVEDIHHCNYVCMYIGIY